MSSTVESTTSPALGEHQEIELPQGTLRYREAGDGEPILFVHGFGVDSRLWDGVAQRLADEARCILPDLPFASHRVPLNEEADLSPVGAARLIADFVHALGLDRVTLVGNDSGGAVSQLVATHHPEVIERLVLTNCDMHDKFPPFPYNGLPLVAKVPGLMTGFAAALRLRPTRWAAFRILTRDALPDELLASWMEPLRDPGIRRDAAKFMGGASGQLTTEAAEQLRGFDRPVLFAWGDADRFFKPEMAERLAADIPGSRIEWIEGGKTFCPIEDPDQVAEAIGSFIRKPAPAPA